MNMPISNKAAVSSFTQTMQSLADKADNQALTSTAAVLLLVRDSGGTNKKSMSALWALLPDSVVTTFQQAKRVNGAINAQDEKANDNAKMVRALWLGAKNQTAFVKGLLELGISSPRGLLDFVAPRGDKKDTVKKSAVDTFMQAAKVEGFAEDVTDLLRWIAEKHAKQMRGLLKQADKALKGALKDASEKQAEIDAKAEKAQAAKDAKAAEDAERTRIHAEKMAMADKAAEDAKSAQAKQEHTAKVTRERATHAKVRDVIEA